MMKIQTVFRYLFLIGTMLIVVSTPARAADPAITAHAKFSPEAVRPGEETVLRLTFEIPEGFILYSPTVVPDGPLSLKITLDADSLKPIGPLYGPAPMVKYDKAFEKNVEFFRHSATLERKYSIDSQPSPSTDSSLAIQIRGQICDHKSCFNQKMTIQADLAIQADAQSTKPPKIKGPVAYTPNREVGEVIEEIEVNRPEKLGIWSFILMAIVAGFGALLTPCVFPMIPITISFFSKYQKLSSGRNLLMAGVYAGSIIIVYTIPGVVLSMIFGAGSMQTISTHPAFNIFISALLIFFGLNLIGLFELRLPSGLIQKSSQKEQRLSSDDGSLKKQLLGVFFMAVTFTLVSFSCTVGFVGGWVLPLAARGDAFYPLIGMLAFSSAFALPFFALAVFPRWAEKLQGKAGDWMVAVKVVFGVIELAAAIKFLSNLDLHFEWGLLTRNVALITWTAVFLIGTLLILNIFQKNAEPFAKPRPIRVVLAVLLLGFALKCYMGIGNTRPMGGWMDGWLPPVPYPSFGEDSAATDDLHLFFMKDDLDGAMAAAQKQHQALFIDFTGFQCANCRQMESNYFPRPEVKKRLAQMTRVKLYTDGPKPVHTQQREYQFDRFNTAVLPFYVILDPSTDTVLSTFSSLASKESDFTAFLDKGLAAFKPAPNQMAEKATTKKPGANSPPISFQPSSERVEVELNHLLSKGTLALSSLRGQWVMVNFWASFCAPCKVELKKDFPVALKNAHHIKLMTIAIEPEETIDSAKQFIENLPFKDHIHLLGDEDWADAHLPAQFEKEFGMPSSFLINPDGFVVWRHNGSVTEDILNAVFEKTK